MRRQAHGRGGLRATAYLVGIEQQISVLRRHIRAHRNQVHGNGPLPAPTRGSPPRVAQVTSGARRHNWRRSWRTRTAARSHFTSGCGGTNAATVSGGNVSACNASGGRSGLSRWSHEPDAVSTVGAASVVAVCALSGWQLIVAGMAAVVGCES